MRSGHVVALLHLGICPLLDRAVYSAGSLGGKAGRCGHPKITRNISINRLPSSPRYDDVYAEAGVASQRVY